MPITRRTQAFSAILVTPFLLALQAEAATSVSVTLSANYAQLQPGRTLQFGATVSGSTNTGVIWQVNNANGGSGVSGTITSAGLFTAPAAIPSPASVTVTAVSQANPMVSATATITLIGAPPTGGVFYVSTTGNDKNPGTKAAPWRTIQHAANTAKAGDTVLVRAGAYRELVAFPSSGDTAHGYITFSSYPGELAAVDGTGKTVPGGQWGLMTLQNVSYLVVQGFELRNYTTASRADVPIGVYIFGAGSNVQIVNNHIHNITTTAATTPTQCGSDALGLVAYGTQAPTAISNLVVSGNEFDHLKTGCSESMSLDGNVDTFAVTSNRVHDNNNIGIDAIGFEKVSPNPAYDQARNGEIRGNVVYNITSFGNPDYGSQYAADGLYIDGGTNITIEQNVIHHVDLGIELASEHGGHDTSFVTARNNVVYGDNSVGITIGGYGPTRGGTDHCTIVNNTLYGNDIKNTGSGELQIQFNATNNVFENNILYATRQGLLINDFTLGASAPAVVDYNLYYSLAGATNAQWIWQKKIYTGYTKYRASTGLDAHSPAFSNPSFVSLVAPPNLDIATGSPAVGAGANLGPAVVGTVDFAGNPRVKGGAINLGAYEQ
jgi:hypothetical protein